MNNYIKYTIFLLVLILGELHAQKITNIRPEVVGENIVILYDLTDDHYSGFDIEIYSSHNNFTRPLRYVQGEVGKFVKPGKDKKIVWDAGRELEGFDGTLSFEIKASVPEGMVKIVEPVHKAILKRGNKYEIKWEGSAENKSVSLFLDNNLVQNIHPSVVLKTNWTIPIDTKPNKAYRLRVADQNNPDLVSYSEVFTIRRRIPLVIKIGIPIALIGGGLGAYFLFHKSPHQDAVPNSVLPEPDSP